MTASARARGASLGLSVLAPALAVLGLALAAAAPPPVAAHPFGNSTINLYARLELHPDEVRVRWVLDMAEVPAIQVHSLIDVDGDGEVSDEEAEAYLAWWVPSLLLDIDLTVDGRALPLEVRHRELTLPAGDAGAPTLRVVLDLAAQLPPSGGDREGGYADHNYADFLGWREVVVVAADGVELVDSSAPAVDRTDELREYPPGLPAADASSTATFAFRPAPAQASGPSPSPAQVAPVAPDAGEALRALLGESLSAGTLALAILLSAGLGALHALSPGHGKTLMAALLIGAHGGVPQAVRLALVVAVGHSLGVVALGALVLGASELLLPQRVVSGLSIAAALLVVVYGIYLLAHGRGAWRQRRAARAPEHLHPHDHPTPEIRLSKRHQLSLGLIGGLLPSGSALVVLLVAVTLDELLVGMVVIGAFGIGMAAAMAGIGLAVVVVRDRAERAASTGHPRLRGLVAALPAASGAAVLGAGVLLSIQALERLP